MKIVVLDGETLNPGDNPWTPVMELGDLEVHASTPTDAIVERSRHADILLTNKVPLSETTLHQLPALKLIGVTATGYNIVDIAAAAARGIAVCNVPVYGTDTVAQYVFAALLHALHRIDLHDRAIRAGEWKRRGNFSFWLQPLQELSGKTFGIIGMGRIGSATARIADAFGMQILASTPHPEQSQVDVPVTWGSAADVFRGSDVVSLHCRLTPKTTGLVNAQSLSWMRPSAILINASRGGLIHEAELAAALHGGKLRAACLDVVSTEPIADDNPLLHAPNCFLTPHLAWATLEARQRLMQQTADNIRAFLRGQPTHLITP